MIDPDLIASVAAITFGIGVILGFIGAGGAGTMLAVLTLVFGLSIHEAVGTSLAAMVFVTISGTISHYRETNVELRAGVIVGLTGMIGAIAGAELGQVVSGDVLQPLAGLALWFLALLMWIRTRLRHHPNELPPGEDPLGSPGRKIGTALLGLSGGTASAFFGVGMAPFLQLGMLVILGLPLRITVGTTMLALIFISLSGSAALASHGQVSVPHLIGATVGMTLGSYAGAKLTGRAPLRVLRAAIVLTPFIAGTLLIVT
ncbi:MAG TPA: sulfite exporter TauE/SafE family protein [Thermomicrobiales bacterium]|nr:sulfite exporter TauE/SafE family protein [Thermomicrobiales bacterium]